MKIKTGFLNLICLMAVTGFSCTKSHNDKPSNEAQLHKEKDIYVAGFNNGKIVYWKNSVSVD